MEGKRGAAGKIILFGEHSVVYGKPAIAVPVASVRANARVKKGKGFITSVQTKERIPISSEHPFALAARNALKRVEAVGFVDVELDSEIPVASGMGSGAACSVAIIRAIAAHNKVKLSDKDVSDIAYESEKLFHGTPSGIDNTAVSFEMPVWFIKGQEPETLKIKKPFKIVIGYTGIKGKTKELVAAVRERKEKDEAKYNRLFDEMGEIATSARKAIERGNIDVLGPLMDRNHELLRAISVSSPELEKLVAAARNAGAKGAKLVGAGGGGNMIALTDEPKKVKKALLVAGAKRVYVTTVGG